MTPDTLRRLTNLLWQRVLAEQCPWYALPGVDSRAARWRQSQVMLARELSLVACGDVAPSEDLLIRAMDFLEGAAP
jgi:hypothetical protein